MKRGKMRGKYLFILLVLFCVQGKAQIQGPNGVTNNIRLWLRADKNVSLSGGNVTSWKDWSKAWAGAYTVPSVSIDKYISSPTYTSSVKVMNFKPAVHFNRIAGNDGYRQYLGSSTGVMKNELPERYTIFTVANIKFDEVEEASSQVIAYFMGFGENYIDGSNLKGNAGSPSMRAPAIGVTGGRGKAVDKSIGKGRFYNYDDGNAYDGQTDFFTPRSTLVAVHEVTKAQYIQYEADGWKERLDKDNGLSNARANAISDKSRMNTGSMLGTASRPSRNMIGYISEVIVYEGILTSAEKEKVYSYLGLRYGITLYDRNKTSMNNFNYMLSDGVTCVWAGKSDALNHKRYHHNVAGLVTDIGHNNNNINNIARSSNEDGFFSIEFANRTSAYDASGILGEKKAVMWGDDNGSTAISIVPFDKCQPYTYNFKRIFLLDKHSVTDNKNTNYNGDSGFNPNYLQQYGDKGRDMTLRASGFSDVFPFDGNGYKVYLLIAYNEAGAKNGNWNLVIPGTFINGEHTFNFYLDKIHPQYYFSFGASANPLGGCSKCVFDGEETLYMSRNNTNWRTPVRLNGTSVTKTGIQTAGGHYSMDVKLEAQTGTKLTVTAPAVHNTNNPVHLRASGDKNKYTTITYTIKGGAADVDFILGDIDQREEVEIYAICGSSQVRPTRVEQLPLSPSQKRQGYTYNIAGVSRFVGNGKQSTGRGNPRGKVRIGFGVAVEKIVITFTNSSSSLRWLDLYPLTFSCPPQPPAPNEAGYSLLKWGKKTSGICETIDYSFYFANMNFGCNKDRVVFSDHLPEGMFWVPGSLKVGAGYLDSDYTSVIQGRELNIDGLLLPGAKTISISAQAAFTDEAVAGTYDNHSSMVYTNRETLQQETLESNTNRTVVTGTKTYKYVKAGMKLSPSDCFKENRTVEVELTVINPNGEIQNNSNNTLYLESYFNENFSYKPGSLKIDGMPVSDTAVGVAIGTGDDNGLVSIEGNLLYLPGNGRKTVSYIIVVPKKEELVLDDELAVGFFMGAITNDICLSNAFLNAFDEYTARYCSSPDFIIVNKMIQPKFVK
ncbi:MAG: hypothetical protein LBQ74_20980 [Prevotella sp.]|jgi:hypothetical protein|nr:hypothetical protein [Prevotella sp.]